LDKKIVLGLKENRLCTLDYEDFDWEKFKRELAKQGVDVTCEEAIPCG